MGVEESLFETKQALLAGDRRAALKALLTAFGVCSHEHIAQQIEKIGQRAVSELAPLKPRGKTRKALIDAWCERASIVADEPEHLSLLLTTLSDGNSKEAEARLTALKAIPSDPRLGHALVQLFEKPPFQAGTTRKFWTLAANLLPDHADTSARAALSKLHGHMVSVLGGATGMGEVMNSLVSKMLVRVPDPTLVTLSAQASALLVEIENLDTSATASATRPRELPSFDTVDWGSLEHAYSTAIDAPEMLRSIASADLSTRRTGLDRAFASLVHQGSVYSATPPFFSFLIELLRHPEQLDKDKILEVLGAIFSQDFLLAVSPAPKRPSAKKIDPETRWYFDAVDVLSAQADLFASLVSHDDPSVRARAVFLLSWLKNKDAARLAIDTFKTSLKTERDAAVRAMLLLGWASLKRATASKSEATLPGEYFDVWVDDKKLRSVCAIAAAMFQGPAIEPKFLRALEHNDLAGATWERLYWQSGNLSLLAKRVEQSLGLKSENELLDELETQIRNRDAMLSVTNADVVRRLFGDVAQSTPKLTLDALSDSQLRYLRLLLVRAETFENPDEFQAWPRLEYRRSWRTTKTLRRFLWLSEQGVLETHVRIDSMSKPIWKVLSDRIYGHDTEVSLILAIDQLSPEQAVKALDEIGTQGWVTYELNIPFHWVRDDGKSQKEIGIAVDQNHRDRYVAALALLAARGGALAERWANALAERELSIVGPNRYRSGESCVLAMTILGRLAKRRGEFSDPRFDPLVTECITTPPAQRSPARVEEILRNLPPDRAENILVQGCGVFRLATATTRNQTASTSYETIHFDDSLRYALTLPFPSLRLAERVIVAVEEWARVHDRVPQQEPACEPLPEADFSRFLLSLGEHARPLLEASLAKGHAGARFLEATLASLRSQTEADSSLVNGRSL